MKYFLHLFFSSILFTTLHAQVVLNADGPGETYQLITDVLAPGYNPIETPDCNHLDFGDHIDETWDSELQSYVFNFHIHVTPDNDRCINFDRQRNEIKTYDKSPENTKGRLNETVSYNWKFKLDADFQPSSSFTHIHQIKGVGGNEISMPVITLTPRTGTPEKLQIMYSDSVTQVEIAHEDLSLFKGVWVEATEKITYKEEGSYELNIKRVSDGVCLFQYSNNNIRMWRTNAEFMRPKWGIYRSLNNSHQLRDEVVSFANISISECNFPEVFAPLIISGNVVKLLWETEFHAERYRIRYRPINGAWTEVLTASTENFRFLNGLIPSTPYEYQIKALCDTENSKWSSSYFFSTSTSICDLPETATPNVLSNTEVFIDWPTDINDLKYKLKYRPSSGGFPWNEFTLNASGMQLSNLLPSTTYKYKLKTKCEGGWTQWTPTFTFTTPSSFEANTLHSSNLVILAPNPSKDFVHIFLPEFTMAQAFLYDSKGQQVIYEGFQGKELTLNISSLEVGVYFLYLVTPNNTYIKKLIKTNLN